MSPFSIKNRHTGFVIRVFGFLLSVWLLGRIINFQSILSVWSQLPAWIFVVALAIAVIRIWLTSERWMILSPAATGIGHWIHFRMLLATGAVNLFFPGLVGSDVARSILLAREAKANASGAVMSVYLDRVVGFLGLLFMGLVATIFSPSLPGRWLYLLTFASLGIVTWLILWSSQNGRIICRVKGYLKTGKDGGLWLQRLIGKPFEALSQCQPGHKKIQLAALLCIPIHGLWYFLVWMVSIVIDVQISFFTIAIVTTLTWILTLFPITFGGFGVRELSFVYLLGLEGVGVEQATLLGLFQSVIVLITSASGLPILWRIKSA